MFCSLVHSSLLLSQTLYAKAFCCWNPNAGVPIVKLQELPALCLSHTHTWWILSLSFLLGKKKKKYLSCLCLKQTLQVLEKRKGIILRCTKKPQIFPIEGNSWHLRNTHWYCLWLSQFCVVSSIGYLPWFDQGTSKLLGIIILNPSLQCFSDIPELLNKLSFMCSSDKELACFWYQPDKIFSIIRSLQYWCCDVCSTELSEHWMSQPQSSCRQNIGKIPSLKR